MSRAQQSDLSESEPLPPRQIKKPATFDEIMETTERKEAAMKENKRMSSQDSTPRTSSTDKLISPTTPTSMQHAFTMSQQQMPTPTYTDSSPVSPMTIPHTERIVAHAEGTNMPWDHSFNPDVGHGAADGDHSAEDTVGRHPASKHLTGKAAIKRPATNGSVGSRVVKNIKKPRKSKRDSTLGAQYQEYEMQSYAQGQPSGVQYQEHVAQSYDREQSSGVEDPDQDEKYAAYAAQSDDGREQPTGFARDRFGELQPLYGDEISVPDGVQRHISTIPGQRGSWINEFGASTNGGAVKAARPQAYPLFRGIGVKSDDATTGVERYAGMGEDPMDAMMTSDEEEEQ